MSLEYNDLTDQQAQALLLSPSPLADIVSEFENRETDYMDSILSCIESRADDLIAAQQKKDRAPLYRQTAAYAREHDELDAYRASFQANVACKGAIEAAIAESYHDNRLDASCVKSIMERFTAERVEYVLAATVQVKDWDERFSRSNKAWAATIPVVNDGNDIMGDRRIRLAVNKHSGLTDLFVTAFREELKQMERAQESPQRESVLAKLQQPVPARTAPAPTARKTKAPEL